MVDAVVVVFVTDDICDRLWENRPLRVIGIQG